MSLIVAIIDICSILLLKWLGMITWGYVSKTA